MPNIIKIYTKNETTHDCAVVVGNQLVHLRKAGARITASNVDLLSFLKLMNDSNLSGLDVEKKKILLKFVADRKIT